MIASIFLSFSLKSILCSTVFAVYYHLALKNARMHRFNRVYLLTAAALSLALPFLKLDLTAFAPVAAPDFPLLHISGKGSEEGPVKPGSTNIIDWQTIVAIVYYFISALLILKLVFRSIWVYRLRLKGQAIKEDGYLLIKTDDPRAPFSFMNMLFCPASLVKDSPEGRSIVMHELAHIRQHHTIDKIFLELVLAACWINPLNWLIKKELWMQHEFLADRDAIENGNSESFARMLLYSITNTTNRSVLNPFFQSSVKRRLLMLTQSARSSNSKLRRFLSIPVLLMVILLLGVNARSTNALPAPEKIVLVLDAAHGGNDAGAKSIYGLLEKDITLTICKKLVALSSEYNVEIVTTRDADEYPSLQERVQKSNRIANSIFISVHLNKSSLKDNRGNSYELGINPKGSNYNRSMILASSIANKLKTQSLPVKITDQNLALVIRENRNPALLIECGNLDDADNIALLKDEARRETFCRNILSGIVDYNAKLGAK